MQYLASSILAQKEIPLGQIGEGPGFGPWAKIADLETATGFLTKILSNLIGFLTIVAGLWFLFRFIIGAFAWLTAGGDKASLENAQKTITNAIIGLVIVVTAYAIVGIIGELLGIEILYPAKIIPLLGPEE